MQSISEYINIFITMLAIVDPIGGIPILLVLMAKRSWKKQMHAAWLAALTVVLVLVISALSGEKLLDIFGIQIAAFRVAGGILLLLIGVKMMLADDDFRSDKSKIARSASEQDGRIFVPLAIPLLSGPGAISSMILYAHRHDGWEHYMLLIAVSIAVGLVTGVTLSLANPVSRLLGENGLKISTKLMGLLLSAAAVQFIANGAVELFPGLIQ